MGLVVLALLYSKTLLDWGRFAQNNELYSHALLIPILVSYLIWIRKAVIPWSGVRSSPVAGGLCAAAGLIMLVAGWGLAVQMGWSAGGQDWLFWAMSAFVGFVFAAGFFFLGMGLMGRLYGPLLMLFWMAPFPTAVERGIESFFQHSSAWAAAGLFDLTGAPVLQEGLHFHMPGMVLEVAPECSGIRSSLVLLISSLLGGYLFLRSPWKRAVLAGFVVPLGILRNGFRIFTIAMLCVHVDPGMIHSWVHRKGGPLFFAFSLIPFLGLILLLRKMEAGQAKRVDRGECGGGQVAPDPSY